MTANGYQKLAMRTANNLEQDDLILNGVLGLNGEVGEVTDIYKKYKYQGHELNRNKMLEELGDVCWYIATLAQGLGLELDEILSHNIIKLQRRYPDGFETEKSIRR